MTTQATVHNYSTFNRSEPLAISVPFSEGAVASSTALNNYVISGYDTSWKVLERWADNSIKIAQAQIYATVSASSDATFEVTSGTALTADFSQHSWISDRWDDFNITTYVEENYNTSTWNPNRKVVYECDFKNDSSFEILSETSLVRTRRWRGYHTTDDPNGISKGDYLAQTLYITEHKNSPLLDITLVIANDYKGSDNPGGSTDPNDYALGHAELSYAGMSVSPTDAVTCAVFGTELDAYDSPGWNGWDLLRSTNTPSLASDGVDSNTMHYIADGSILVWKFVIMLPGSSASAGDITTATQTAEARAEEPMEPLVKLDNWQETSAFGIVGAIADGNETTPTSKAAQEYSSFLSRSDISRYGDWGDAADVAQPGTPRNSYVAHEHTIYGLQDNEFRTIRVLRGMAMAQGLRQYHLWKPTTIPRSVWLFGGVSHIASTYTQWTFTNNNLGRDRVYGYFGYSPTYSEYRQNINMPSGGPSNMSPFDHEHFTVDIVADYYALTGDEWAKDELFTLGIMLTYSRNEDAGGDPEYRGWSRESARSEGWSIAGAIRAYLATQDTNLSRFVENRINNILVPLAGLVDGRPHPSKCLAYQGIGGYLYRVNWSSSSDLLLLPWQHGSLGYALVGAYKLLDVTSAKNLALNVVDMVDWQWIADLDGYKGGNPVGYEYLRSDIENGSRFYAPLTKYENGAHTFINANHYDYMDPNADPDDKNLYNPYCGESPLGGSNLFLVAPLFFIANEFSSESQATTATNYARLLHGLSTNWREDKWLSTVSNSQINTWLGLESSSLSDSFSIQDPGGTQPVEYSSNISDDFEIEETADPSEIPEILSGEYTTGGALVNTGNFGIEIRNPQPWDTAYRFKNWCKAAQTWYAYSIDEHWSEVDEEFTLTTEGYPEYIPDNLQARSTVQAVWTSYAGQAGKNSGNFPSGDYVFTYNGHIDSISIGGDAVTVKNENHGEDGGRIEFNSDGTSTFYINMYGEIQSPLSGFCICESTYEGDWEQEDYWYPAVLKELAGFSCIQFESWDICAEWAYDADFPGFSETRAKNHYCYISPKNESQYTNTPPYDWKAIPYELQIDLVNKLETSLWITIPAKAGDKFVEELSSYVSGNLHSGASVYIEYCVEPYFEGSIESPVTQGAKYCHYQGTLSGYDNPQVDFYAIRFNEIAGIFKENTDHTVYPYLTSPLNEDLSTAYRDSWIENLANHFLEGTVSHASGWATSAYYGAAIKNDGASYMGRTWNQWITADVEELNEQLNSLVVSSIDNFGNLVSTLEGYGVTLPVGLYEFGMSAAADDNSELSEQDTIGNLIRAAIKHPDEYWRTLYQFNALQDKASGMFCYYAGAGARANEIPWPISDTNLDLSGWAPSGAVLP